MSAGYDQFFRGLRVKFGVGCFENNHKLKRIRNTLYNHIRSQCNYKRVVQDIIRAGLAVHTHTEETELLKRAGLDSHEASSGTIGLVVLAAHLCQKYQILDAELVKRAVVLIFHHDERGFGRFFSFLDPLVFPYEVDPILFPESSENSNSFSDNLIVLSYFLQSVGHLVKVKFNFSELNLTENVPIKSYTRNIPMVDAPVRSCRGSTPLLMACQSISPEAVLLLLRYGANPLLRGQANQIIGFQFQQPLYVIVSKLNASLFWYQRQTTLSEELQERFRLTHQRQAVELKLCLQYFCRALPKLPIGIRREGRGSEERHRPMELCLLSDAYSDALPANRYREPATLEHLCRCTIRSLLVRAGNLPGAIYELDIPKMLQAYLDLLID